MATAVKHDANSDIFRGQLFLFIGDQPVAFATSASLNTTTEEVEVSNKMMGDWAASLPGKKSFTISSESLLSYKEGQMSYNTLLDKQIKSETLEFFIGDVVKANDGSFTKDATKPHYKGVVMITSLDLKSDNGAIATCSASLKGIGALVRENGTVA